MKKLIGSLNWAAKIKALETALCLEKEARARSEAFIVETLDERKILLSEINHRVKNNLQTILSLLRLQSGNTSDPSCRDVLNQAVNRVQAISMVHERLYKSSDLNTTDASEYFSDLAKYLVSTYKESGEGGIEFDLKVEPLALDLDRCIACGLIISELVTNAVKHAFPASRPGGEPARIMIGFDLEGNLYHLRVADNGVGMPERALSEKGNTLGLKIVQTLVRQLKGGLDITSAEGLSCSVRFPSVSSPTEVGKPSTLRRIKRAIASLPESERVLATKYYIDGWTSLELSPVLGIEQGPLDERLLKLRQLIREALSKIAAEAAE